MRMEWPKMETFINMCRISLFSYTSTYSSIQLRHRCWRSVFLILLVCRALMGIQLWFHAVASRLLSAWEYMMLLQSGGTILRSPQKDQSVCTEFRGTDYMEFASSYANFEFIRPFEIDEPSAAVTIQRWCRGHMARKRLHDDMAGSLVRYSREVDSIELLLRRGFCVYGIELDQRGCAGIAAPCLLQLEGCRELPTLKLYKLENCPYRRREIDVFLVSCSDNCFGTNSTSTSGSNTATTSTACQVMSTLSIWAAGESLHSPEEPLGRSGSSCEVILSEGTDGRVLRAAIQLLVDRELSASSLRDRGRKRWWEESVRPMWKRVSPRPCGKALAWAAVTASSPLEVVMYSPRCSDRNKKTSWRHGDALILSSRAATITVTMSSPIALCHDTLAITTCHGWWERITQCGMTSTSLCDWLNVSIGINDIVEVRSGIDSYLFRRMVESEVLDASKSATVAAIFTKKYNFYVEFTDERCRDEFVNSIRALHRILLMY